MKTAIAKDQWEPRQTAIIFADEDVDGVCSAAIVGRLYHSEDKIFAIRFVNARNLGETLKKQAENSHGLKTSIDNQTDIFIVDVGINKANIKLIQDSISDLIRKGARVMYFDSHSNKYKGKNLLTLLAQVNVNVYNGKIGLAAASIVQDFLGNEETYRLRLLGALSDREIQLTNRYKNEKPGLRALQAAVAWGAYKDHPFLDKITRRLIRHPNLDLEADKDILEYSIKANNHRDNLLRHVHKNARILQLSESPRILCVTALDRVDFGKARGTIAGRLAGEWGSCIILITQSVNYNNSFAITVRNSYIHKLDLEILGQLAKTKNSGGSKGAYRLTIPKDDLISFLSKVQTWARSVVPPWQVDRSDSKKRKKTFRRNKKRSWNPPKHIQNQYGHSDTSVHPMTHEIEDSNDNEGLPGKDDFEFIEVIEEDNIGERKKQENPVKADNQTKDFTL